jgi:hypothetical protein
MSGVYKATGSFTTVQTMLGDSSNQIVFGHNTSASLAAASGNGAAFVTVAATDNQFHALNVFFSTGITSFIAADGVSSSTGTTATSNLSNTLRFARGAGCCTVDGITMEAGVWNASFNSTQAGNININQHGTNGYNF